MNKLNFGNWLIAEVEKRGVFLNDIAVAGGMDKSTLFRIAKGERAAGVDSILAIAKGLSLSPCEVFTRATGGALPENDARLERALHLFSQLPVAEQEMMLHQLQATLDYLRREGKIT